jgi:hypothetical protein
MGFIRYGSKDEGLNEVLGESRIYGILQHFKDSAGSRRATGMSGNGTYWLRRPAIYKMPH